MKAYLACVKNRNGPVKKPPLKNRYNCLSIFLPALLVLNASCMQQSDDGPSKSPPGKSELRSALISLDKGDLDSAEQQLKASLRADPLNSRARTTLASIQAQRAGVSLRSWLEPFINASRDIETRMAIYRNSIETLEQNGKNAYDLANPTTPLSEADENKRKQSFELVQSTLKANFIISILLDMFRSMPYLNDYQLKKLEEAILTLRGSSLSASARDEEERVYQAILSAILTINHTRRLLGDEDTLTRRVWNVCTQKKEVILGHMRHLRTDLTYLEEGLTINPKDPMTSQRAARERIQNVISEILNNRIWREYEDYFNPLTELGLVGLAVAKNFCSKLPASR